jgi:endoglycosylceramidase
MMAQSYICNIGVKQSAPPITVNGVREPLQCFGPHSYDMTVDTPLYKYANADRVKTFFSEMRNTQLRLNVPVIVGEWGGCSDNTDTSWFPHAYELIAFFDEQQWSQVYWDYHGDDLDKPIMTLLRRTHPVAVPGEIKRYGYDRKTNVFTLEFTCEDKGEALIYVHNTFTVDNDVKYKVVEDYGNGASLIAIKTKPGDTLIEINITE